MTVAFTTIAGCETARQIASPASISPIDKQA